MNIDKIAPMAAVAISLIAVFVPFEYWALAINSDWSSTWLDESCR